MTPPREVLAGRFRDWIHGQPFSLCTVGADECPDWPMAYELADLALEEALFEGREELLAKITSGRAGERELQDEIVELRRTQRKLREALLQVRHRAGRSTVISEIAGRALGLGP